MNTIITSPNFDYLGEKLHQELDIPKANVGINKFPDGTPNLFIEKKDVKNKIAHIIMDFSNIDDIFTNYTLLQGLVDYKVKALNIIMPYFPVGTMERVGKIGEVATAHTFANIISNLPSGRSEKNRLHIIDLHAEVEEFLFDANKISVETYTALDLLKKEIDGKTIIFPDAGAAKRFEKSFKDNPKVVCSKKRIGGQRIIEVLEGKIDGKDGIIIDDLVQSGGTLIETAKALKNMGAKSIEAFVTHGVFPNNSQEKLAKNLDNITTTDSIPKNIQKAQKLANMEIVGIKEIVKNIILEY